MLRQLDGLCQAIQQLGRHAHGVLGLVHLGQHHHELVAPEARHDVVLAHGLAQALRGDAQKLVTHAMAQAVVDALEVVHVEEQHGQASAVAPCVGHKLVQAGFERVAVGQAGEGVVVRQPFDGLGGLPLLGDVGINGDKAPMRDGRAHQVDHHAVGPHTLHVVVRGMQRLGRELGHEALDVHRAVFTALGVEAGQLGEVGPLVHQLAGKAQQADGLVVHQYQVQVLVENAHAAGQVVGQGLQQFVLFGQGGFARLVFGDVGVAGDKAHDASVGLHGAALDQVRAARRTCAFQAVGLKAQGPLAALLHVGLGVARAKLAAPRRVTDQVVKRQVGVHPFGGQVEHVQQLVVPAFEAQLVVKHRDALG